MGRRGKKSTKPVTQFEDVALEENEAAASIKDENLHPYFIRVDTNCFTVFKEGNPIMVGCFTNLGYAVKRIIQEKISKTDQIMTLNTFIHEYEALVKSVLDKINIGKD